MLVEHLAVRQRPLALILEGGRSTQSTHDALARLLGLVADERRGQTVHHLSSATRRHTWRAAMVA